MAVFCANLVGLLTKILKISGTINSQIFYVALFFLPNSQIIDTHFTTVMQELALFGVPHLKTTQLPKPHYDTFYDHHKVIGIYRPVDHSNSVVSSSFAR